MKWYIQLVIALAIIVTVGGLAYREQLIRVYPYDVRYYQNIVRKVCTDEYEAIFLEEYPELDPRPYNGQTPEYLLRWLGMRLSYNESKAIERYDDPIEIIEYGKGRCHEFSVAYLAIMYVQGYTPRLVIDDSPENDTTDAEEGDHIWIEYHIFNDYWIHVDPTQGAVYANSTDNFRINDYVKNPMMYEEDWKKDVTVVWAIEPYHCERIEENYQYE